MDLETIYENVERRDIKNKTGRQTKSHDQDEDQNLKRRGSRCLALIAVSLGFICVLLLVFIILQHITITAERDLIKSYKNTAEEFNQTINSLQNNFSSLSQKNLELEINVISLSDKLKKESTKRGGSRCLVLIAVSLGLICVLLLVFIILQHITITAERDLIKSYKNTVEEFNQTINSLQNNYTDLMETRVKDLTAEKTQLQRSTDSLTQKKLELETSSLL
ncbi:hypothetical protein QQF64_000033 [Cirrhinus molitorella]|uniref:Uncharacterized protein n=1 Tax=Cirrhinus molitorella TaxID=172907 RepID=A0ABR3NXK9_9TELE